MKTGETLKEVFVRAAEIMLTSRDRNVDGACIAIEYAAADSWDARRTFKRMFEPDSPDCGHMYWLCAPQPVCGPENRAERLCRSRRTYALLLAAVAHADVVPEVKRG